MPGNPLMQDVVSSKTSPPTTKPRFYAYAGSPGNYGSIPQTWEDSTVSDKLLQGYPGDNDPVDFIDVGDARASVGAPYLVRVLGCLGMVDGGEADYKVIVVNAADPRARLWRSMSDVPEVKWGSCVF